LSLAIILADLILIFHFIIVIFNISGLLAIWTGYFFKWKWIRNPFFRYIHLVMIGFVTLNAALGKYCPLTSWEVQLRKAGGQEAHGQSFIQYWVGRLLYVDVNLDTLSLIYFIFLIVVIVTFFVIKPEKIKTLEKIK